MRSPIVTDTGIWNVETLAVNEGNDPEHAKGFELRRPQGLEEFAARAIAAADDLRAYADTQGYNLLETPQPHVPLSSVFERNQPYIVVSARAISKESGITSLRDDRPRHRAEHP